MLVANVIRHPNENLLLGFCLEAVVAARHHITTEELFHRVSMSLIPED